MSGNRKKPAKVDKENMSRDDARENLARAEARAKAAKSADLKASRAASKFSLSKNYKSMPNSKKKVEREFQTVIKQGKKQSSVAVMTANAALKIARKQYNLFNRQPGTKKTTPTARSSRGIKKT